MDQAKEIKRLKKSNKKLHKQNREIMSKGKFRVFSKEETAQYFLVNKPIDILDGLPKPIYAKEEKLRHSSVKEELDET